jgi:uncharacterized protein YggU (UPF0235/DUF167 family)
MPADRPWTIAADGLRLTVRLTPRGGRDAIDGIERRDDGTCMLKARVRRAPQDGAANAALQVLVAERLSLPPSRVRLIVGATARVKVLQIDGDGAALAARLQQMIDQSKESTA